MQVPQSVHKGTSGKSDLIQKRGSFPLLLSMALMLATFAITRSAVADVVYLDNAIYGEDSEYYVMSVSGSNCVLANYVEDSGILISGNSVTQINDPSAIGQYDELLNPGTTPLGVSGST